MEKIVADLGNGFSFDGEYSSTSPDSRIEAAFVASQDLVSRTFSEDDWKRMRRHNAVAYVLSPPIERGKALAVSSSALELTARLIKGGATAVKSESAGIAHGLSHWMRLAERTALREAWVRQPIQDEKILYSCGMHLLGLRDVECVGAFQDTEAVRWIDAVSDALIAGRAIPNDFLSTMERRTKAQIGCPAGVMPMMNFSSIHMAIFASKPDGAIGRASSHCRALGFRGHHNDRNTT